MEGIISTILSLFGLGQQAVQSSSEKRNEASKLNSEFELLLGKNAEMLRSEDVHLRHRIDAIPGDTSDLYEQVSTTIRQLLSELDVGFATAANSRKTILAGSSFASLSRWDEVISLLHQQRGAAELQFERSKMCIEQFHRILDQAVTSSPIE